MKIESNGYNTSRQWTPSWNQNAASSSARRSSLKTV